MNTIKISLLGRPLVEWRGRQVDRFVSEKALTLFAYLVVHPGKQARETLAGLFWGDMSTARARANLRMAVYNLQQLFPGYLLTARLSLAFDRDQEYWLDVEQFEKTLQPGSGFEAEQIRTVEQALSLYRGDFLEGIYLDEAVELYEWLLVERERLRQLALRGFQWLASRRMEAGEFTQAIPAWQKLLRLEPWQESAHQGLMQALARSGDYSAALQQYEICQRLLSDELHVEPMPETRQLYQRIRTARQLKSRHNLPPQPTPFIGRERELKELAKYLADPQTRLITITGPGGVGKSRLAMQAAAGQVHAFLHGVCLVPLESLDAPESIPAAIGASLEISFHGKTPLRAQLLQFLQDREMLLVLDNFEHLVEGANWVAEILAEAPQVRILATSRQRLSLLEEHLFQLSGMEYPVPGDSEQRIVYPAVQLFLEAGQRALNRFAPGEQEQSSIYRICELLEGMPLGIEMAAAWVRDRSLAEIAAGIEANLKSLSTSMRNMPDRHHSLQAVFEQSWTLLTGEEKHTLSLMAIFRGGFTSQAAASVTGADAESLNALADKSLLQITPLPHRDTWYHMHAVVRQFAYERLQAAGEDAFLREKYLVYYLRFLEEAGARLNQPDQAIWAARIDRDYPNLLQALEWGKGYEGRALTGLRLCIALAHFWEMRGYFRDGLERLRTALEACEEVPIELQVSARVWMGRLAFLAGEFDLSRWNYEESIRLCRATQNAAGMLDSLNGMVAVLTDQGEYQQAGQLGEEALERARQSGDKDKIALATNNLGLLGWYQGNHAAARRYLNESLQLRRETGNQLGIGYALNNLALLILDEGQPAEAAHLLEESLAIRQELGDRRGMSFVLANLGTTAQYQGDFQRASKLFNESLDIRRTLGDQHYIAHTLGNLGSVAQALGDFLHARDYYEEGLSIARRLEEPLIIAFLSRGLGSLFSDLANYDQARPVLEHAVSLERTMGSKRSLGMVLEKMGQLAYRTEDDDVLQSTANEACILFTDIHNPRGIARAHLLLGKLDARHTRSSEAAEHFQTAFEIVASAGNPLEIAAVLEGIARLYGNGGQLKSALLLLGRAKRLREAAGTPLPPADQPGIEGLVNLARIQLSEADFQRAWEKGQLLSDEQCLRMLDSLQIL